MTPRDLSEVDLKKLPIVEIDKDGEVVTGFMVADNYFELYINGKLIGVDATRSRLSTRMWSASA